MSGPEKNRAPRQTPPDPKARETRLKAALQANIAKRKALARAKAEEGDAPAKDKSAD